LGGPDAAFSLEPHEFKELVKRIRELEEKGIILSEEELRNFGISYGTATYGTNDNAKEARPALWVNANIKEGEELTEGNIRVARPGVAGALVPKYFFKVLGKKATKDLEKGLPLTQDLFT